MQQRCPRRPIASGRYTQEQVQQLHGRVDGPAQGAAVRRVDPPVVHVGRLRRGPVPALAVGHGLSGVQRGGVAELGPVAHRGLDVEHRHLADEHVPAEGDRARLDQAGVGPVAGEERVLADDRAVADGEQVGAHGHVPGEDRDAAPDLRAQRPQIERRTAANRRTAGPAGSRWTSVLTIQKRTYARLQTRICWGFHRPMSTHLARIGRMHRPRNSRAAEQRPTAGRCRPDPSRRRSTRSPGRRRARRGTE